MAVQAAAVRGRESDRNNDRKLVEMHSLYVYDILRASTKEFCGRAQRTYVKFDMTAPQPLPQDSKISRVSICPNTKASAAST